MSLLSSFPNIAQGTSVASTKENRILVFEDLIHIGDWEKEVGKKRAREASSDSKVIYVQKNICP